MRLNKFTYKNLAFIFLLTICVMSDSALAQATGGGSGGALFGSMTNFLNALEDLLTGT